LYHEARNVRHPIKAGALPEDTKYERLRNLPNNRNDAWLKMAKVREKAGSASTAAEVADIFRKEYGMSMEDLSVLYHEPCWKSSPYGGNKWAAICSTVIDLLKALNSGDEILSTQLIEKILQMRHHTGTILAKLKNLKQP